MLSCKELLRQECLHPGPELRHSKVDAAHKRCQKYDTHILSNIPAKEIPRQSYTDNALQMQAN